MTELQAITKISKRVSDLTVDDIAEYCDQCGITVSSLCKKLKEMLEAKREIYDRDGDYIRSEDDNSIQFKSLTVGLELLKLIRKDAVATVGRVEHSMAPEDIIRLEAIAIELKGLEKKLTGDKVQQGKLDVTDATIIR